MEGSGELRNQWTIAGSKTKPWNVTLTNVEPNEELYIDYKEAAKINQTSVKFKTTPDRIKFWVTAHEQIYGDENLWQFKQNVVTLKVKEPNKGNLIVKFYLSTGVVLVQGSEFFEMETWTLQCPKGQCRPYPDQINGGQIHRIQRSIGEVRWGQRVTGLQCTCRGRWYQT